MGITIHQRGTLDDLNFVEEMEDHDFKIPEGN